MFEKMKACVFSKTKYNSKFSLYYGGCGIGDRFLAWRNRKTEEIEVVKVSRPENASVEEIIEAIKDYD